MVENTLPETFLLIAYHIGYYITKIEKNINLKNFVTEYQLFFQKLKQYLSIIQNIRFFNRKKLSIFLQSP